VRGREPSGHQAACLFVFSERKLHFTRHMVAFIISGDRVMSLLTQIALSLKCWPGKKVLFFNDIASLTDLCQRHRQARAGNAASSPVANVHDEYGFLAEGCVYEYVNLPIAFGFMRKSSSEYLIEIQFIFPSKERFWLDPSWGYRATSSGAIGGSDMTLRSL